jgi:uncharacterized membrane protein
MSTFAVVVFPDERRANEGLRALEVLHEEGSVTAYSTAVVGRRPDGTVDAKEETGPGAVGFGAGALVGALVGQLGAPPGAAAGLAAGALVGGWRDHLHAEVTDEFLESVARDLAPGRFAVVAEISEEWLTPLDARMEALGGTVTRAWRQDFVEDFFEKHKVAWKTELEKLRAQRAAARLERMDSMLVAEIADAEESLRKIADGALKRLGETRAELEAKLAALQEQVTKTEPDVRSRVELRIIEIRADLREREAKLLRAYTLAREAVGAPAMRAPLASGGGS